MQGALVISPPTLNCSTIPPWPDILELDHHHAISYIHKMNDRDSTSISMILTLDETVEGARILAQTFTV